MKSIVSTIERRPTSSLYKRMRFSLVSLLIWIGTIFAVTFAEELNDDASKYVAETSVDGGIEIIPIPTIETLPVPKNFPAVNLNSKYNSICEAYNQTKSLLWMDVQWIIQGYEISFQGFFVEFLGIAESFQNLLPLGKLVKSSFRKSFDEIPVKNYQKFFERDLFPKERDLVYWLISKYHPQISGELQKTYDNEVTPMFPMKEPLSPSNCLVSDDLNPLIQRNTEMFSKAELSRSTIQAGQEGLVASSFLSMETAVDCCNRCESEKFCTQWTFYENIRRCKLGNMLAAKTNYSDHHHAITGKIALNSSATTPVYRSTKPKALIFHGTTCIHENSTSTFHRDVNTIYIGRYMLERSSFTKGLSLDEYAVSYCSSLMDEIWVPTEWHKIIFEKFLMLQGIRKPEIIIIPEAVDTTLFLPSYYHQPTTSSTTSETYQENYHFIHSHRTVQKQCHFIDISETNQRRVTCADQSNYFEFLSIFKWEYRKGWDILLTSYWKTFSKDDQVLLRLRSYVPKSEQGDRNITRQIEKFAFNTFGKSLSELAEVVWENGNAAELESESLTREQMKNLLETADAFVLPTRGEGWGLPIAEAMAMELPVLVTNATGILAYAREENAYLISVENALDDLSFVIPSEESLSSMFREVIEDFSAEREYRAITKGQKARSMMKYFSSDMIMCKINERLRFQAKRRGWSY